MWLKCPYQLLSLSKQVKLEHTYLTKKNPTHLKSSYSKTGTIHIEFPGVVDLKLQ